MIYYITDVHMVGGSQHEHIANVKWVNAAGTETGTTTRADMVNWIKNQGGDTRVRDGQGSVPGRRGRG